MLFHELLLNASHFLSCYFTVQTRVKLLPGRRAALDLSCSCGRGGFTGGDCQLAHFV